MMLGEAHSPRFLAQPISTSDVSRPLASVLRGAARVSLRAAAKFNIPARLQRCLPANVAVLVYHRIGDPSEPGFYGFGSVVSATRPEFARQLDYLKANCNVIGMSELLAWRRGEFELPGNAVLITFDDGYRDNLTSAAPELQARDLPAVLFLTSGFADGTLCFSWDWIAEAFKTTQLRSAKLPVLGDATWDSARQRSRIAAGWIAAGKGLDHCNFRRQMLALATMLDVPPPSPAPRSVRLDWADIRALMTAGFAIGAHTATHPILSRVSLQRAAREIAVSRTAIERQIAAPVSCFAYPNGLFNEDHEKLVEQEGLELAFRAEGGVAFAGEIKRRPLAIRRICISLKDDIPRFAAKVMGATRLMEW